MMSCRCVGRILRDHAHQRLPEEKEGESRTQTDTKTKHIKHTKGTKERKNYNHNQMSVV